MTADGPERQLSPEEEMSVSRALRDLPAPPLPPALAERLDAQLAQLRAERSVGSRAPLAGVPVAGVPVAADVAARRRRWPRLLLAAAAVLVGGYAVGTAVDGSLGGAGSADSSAGASGSTADHSTASRSTAVGGADRLVRSSPVALHAASLSSDVRRLLRAGSPKPAAALGAACPLPPGAAGGASWLVRYDGGRAVLVTHRLPDHRRVRATVYACGGTAPAATTTVRAP
jgi:hypothetical protein